MHARIKKDGVANGTHTLERKLEATHWGTAVVVAFIAGALFLILQMFLSGLASGASPITAARMAAAIPPGRSALPGEGLDFRVLLTALLPISGWQSCSPGS
jgi:hypothetical protein